MRCEPPDGSIYFWMYTMGLKHVPIDEVKLTCAAYGKDVRPKDIQNYWNGYHNSDLYHGAGNDDVFMLKDKRFTTFKQVDFIEQPWTHYELHPYLGMPEVQNRWVPCSATNKPLIKWSNGCMTMADALAVRNQVYLAENLKGTKCIVIDCDGDHGERLDMETIMFLSKWRDVTHCLSKPKAVREYEGYEHTGIEVPASFHLTFMVPRIIPTMHFPYAGIDIVGNRRNSLRYWKNKKWNGIEPVKMTEEIWDELREYVKYRKEKANA